ncbi:hypothetical protein EW026_g1446 [Hermanssonia centrifuga]|uniref:VASt domain-containing protein n=1 Tax=Hermanssonia centrifuga TaxID=98765 RepID=A0A4S4KW23_9APHY|nr:hypothetical protein EW026_g1446 [Hermanssonia centrifuga]
MGNSSDNLAGSNSKPARRLHSLSLGSNPTKSPVSPPTAEDDAATPTPMRPTMSGRESTARPLSHASSTGNLREEAINGAPHHPRSATVSNGNFERQQEHDRMLRRSPSNKSNKSTKSNRSGLRIKLKSDHSPPLPQPKADHSIIVPPHSYSEDANEEVSLIVESPTGITPRTAVHDVGPSKSSIAASQTLPNIPNSSFLAAPDNSDTVSVYSVGGTKKRRIFRRGSVKEGTSPVTPSLPSASKSPKRKNTGLASALAASGLAMVNPAIAMPQIAPVDVMARTDRSNSLNSNGYPHRSRGSVDNTRSPARSRQTSLSYATSDYSDRDSFVSGVEGGSEDDDDLDLDADDIPVTGFAVASARRNQEFHEMFPSIPEGDYLIEDYGCALQREILIQGRIYISENHVCFHANIFGWITDLSIPMYDVTALDKRMTAFVIPNAIQVTTRGTKYTFTSFLSRDTTFDVIYNVWRLARPENSSIGSALPSARASLDTSNDSTEGASAVVAVNGKLKARGQNKVTQCACGKAGQHYSEVAMESVLPGTPEKIYNLMFASGFIKEFMRVDQKLMDIQISDWIPLPDNSTLLSRNMSYIKPLSGSIGPKQTKCELRDEIAHCDFEEYVSMLTTTRTPDVPSGSVFSVKTRTCIMWASSVSTRIIVSTQVEWTGRSFIKGIIEKSCIDGQKTYHAELEKGMRDYIHNHQSEFIPEGVDPAVVEEAEAQVAAESPGTPALDVNEEQARKVREKERNQRGLQWAYDTFEGAMKVAKQSTEGALELIKDAWDQSSSSTIQYFVIVLLVISNIWTLTTMGRQEEVGRRKEIRRTEDREKWVQGVVTALWDELTNTKAEVIDLPVPSLAVLRASTNDVKAEVAELNNVLDKVEERVRIIRGSLQDLD